MKQTFTSEDLIRFLYKETSASETMAMQQALQEDLLLREEYRELRKGYEQLPKVTFSPAPATLQHILQYSKHSALKEQA